MTLKDGAGSAGLEVAFTPGVVSTMPVHSGDGYSWGGDVVVTFGDKSINLGSSHNYATVKRLEELAHLIAAAPELLDFARAFELFVRRREDELGGVSPEMEALAAQGRAALSRAGKSS